MPPQGIFFQNLTLIFLCITALIVNSAPTHRSNAVIRSTSYKATMGTSPPDDDSGRQPISSPVGPPANGTNDEDVFPYIKVMESRVKDFIYFSDSEVVLVLDESGRIFKSNDEGRNWENVMTDSAGFTKMVKHEHDQNRAYFFSAQKKLYFTKDKGTLFESIELPLEMNQVNPAILDFHPNGDWLIYTGSTACHLLTDDCFTTSYYTKDHGKTWTPLDTFVEKCMWARDRDFQALSDDAIFCASFKEKTGRQDFFSFEKNQLQFWRTDDLAKSKTILFEQVVAFLVFNKYVAVAAQDEGMSLDISTDGKTFTKAEFPMNANIKENGYTILDASSASVFVDVLANTRNRMEWGDIFVSNSAGTVFSNALQYSNRNDRGYVDFESMQGLEGIILANQVSNPRQVLLGVPKEIQSRISFDHGATWKPVKSVDTNCVPPECGLHLHSVTDRHNIGKVFSSLTAPGMMMGVGNIGKKLLKYSEGDTFLTRDGGLSWKRIREGAYLYEFGNYGAILVIADDEKPTDRIWYSYDQGNTWNDFVFADQKLRVRILTIEPTSTSQKFLILAETLARGSVLDTKDVLIQLDFNQLQKQKCVFDKTDQEKNDFELWSPSSSHDTVGCFLGQKKTYWRRKQDRKCYIDDKYEDPQIVTEHCECTAQDYECDVNFVRNSTNHCVPIGNIDHSNRKVIPSGYRKISASLCEGGLSLDTPLSKEEGLPLPVDGTVTGVGIFWIIMTPIIVMLGFGAAGYFGYKKFGHGQIRLPENLSNIRMPSFSSFNLSSVRLPRRNGYMAVNQEDTTSTPDDDVLLEDY